MTMKKTLLISVFALQIAVCSLAQNVANVIFIGNSITFGATLPDRSEMAPPAVVGRLITEKVGAVGIANLGVCGATTTDWLPGSKMFATATSTADKFIANKSNDATLVFSISLGTNDSAAEGTNGAALSNADYRKNMRAIIDSLNARYPRAHFVIHHPIYYSPNTYNSARYLAEGQHRLSRYRSAVDDIVSGYRRAKNYRVHLGDTSAWDIFAADNSLFTPEAGKAGTFFLHPNKRGAEKLGTLWAEPIVEVVKNARPQHVKLSTGAEMLVYPSHKPNPKRAIVICPGGGYTTLAREHEGTEVAQWAATHGLTAFVLFYRMPHADYRIPQADARKAIEYARQYATTLGGYTEVGIMGSSAGGHLASTIATHSPELVDFQVLLYPVISMIPGLTHQGSHDNLLGTEASEQLTIEYSNDKKVSEQTPRAFIALSLDDKTVPPLPNGVAYAEALTRKSVKTTLLCYPIGGHGWGFRENFAHSSQWKKELELFLCK